MASQPICLHPDRENLIVGKRATVVGWGKMSHVQRQPVMQFLEVPLAAWDQCSRIYGSTGALESPKSVGTSSPTFLPIKCNYLWTILIIFDTTDGQWMCAGGEGKRKQKTSFSNCLF